MELRNLGSDFQPDTVIENYKSLIWTERYRDAGDFQLKTHDIEKTLSLMPLGSMVSVKDGYDCMFVEDCIIEKDPDGAMELTLSGRSFETFFENRVAHEGSARMFTLDGDPEAVGTPQYAWQLASTGEASSKYAYEIIRYRSMIATDGATYIPNLTCVVADNAKLGPKPRRYITVQIGNVYERVIEILEMDDLGIRAVLPAPGGNVITMYIYAGEDISDRVVFSESAGHFEKTSYASSTREWRNGAIAHSQWDWTYNFGSSTAGLGRRFGWVDAGDITHQSYSINSNLDEKELQSRIATYLTQHKMLGVFAGTVSPDIPFKYMTDYALGDIVRVMANYGTNQKMRVSEYIRVEDQEGERAYPTLELP